MMPAQPYIKDFSKRLPTKAIENFTEAMVNFSKMLQGLDLSPWQKEFAKEALGFRTYEEQRELFDESQYPSTPPFGHWSTQGRGLNPLVSYTDEVPYFNSQLHYIEGLLLRSLYGRSFLSYIQTTPNWIVLAAQKDHYAKSYL